MAGSETFPQLISIRIFTFLSNAAALMVSSISDQYLFNKTPQSEQKQQHCPRKKNYFTCEGKVHLWGFA